MFTKLPIPVRRPLNMDVRIRAPTLKLTPSVMWQLARHWPHFTIFYIGQCGEYSKPPTKWSLEPLLNLLAKELRISYRRAGSAQAYGWNSIGTPSGNITLTFLTTIRSSFIWFQAIWFHLYDFVAACLLIAGILCHLWLHWRGPGRVLHRTEARCLQWTEMNRYEQIWAGTNRD